MTTWCFFRLKAYEIPEGSRTARGTAIVNLIELDSDEKITATIPIEEFREGEYLIMCTKNGTVKKTPLPEYKNVRKMGLIAINLRDDDELIEVKLTDGERDVFLVTKNGKCIRFKESDVRSMGRTATGVRGMKLNDDEVIAMQLDNQGKYLLMVSEKGIGKRTGMEEFSPQNRGGMGVKCYNIIDKTGPLAGVKAVDDDSEIMLISTSGIIIRMPVESISINGKYASGVKLINLDEGASVAGIAKVREEESPQEEEDSEGEDKI